jgi:hypothetical protein
MRRFIRRRWRRIVGWIALLGWPALLPHPADAIAGCIWYAVLGLTGMIYFISKIQVDTADRQAPVPAGDSTPAISSVGGSRPLASVPGPSSPSWPEESDSPW